MAVCILWLIGEAVGFIAMGYGTAKTKVGEKKKEEKGRRIDLWLILAVVGILAGSVCSWRSLDTMRAITIGRAGTPPYLDKSTFYRALSTGESLSGKKIVDIQNAADETFQMESDIPARRGDFLQVVGKELKIVEPNTP